MAIVGLIGWFGWSVGRPGDPPVFLLPIDAIVGDVVLSGTFASDYRICAIGPYESCGTGCSVPEYEILFQAVDNYEDVLWQQSYARIARSGKTDGVPSPESGMVSHEFLQGFCVEKDAFQSFKLIVNDIKVDETETSVMLDLK